MAPATTLRRVVDASTSPEARTRPTALNRQLLSSGTTCGGKGSSQFCDVLVTAHECDRFLLSKRGSPRQPRRIEACRPLLLLLRLEDLTGPREPFHRVPELEGLMARMYASSRLVGRVAMQQEKLWRERHRQGLWRQDLRRRREFRPTRYPEPVALYQARRRRLLALGGIHRALHRVVPAREHGEIQFSKVRRLQTHFRRTAHVVADW